MRDILTAMDKVKYCFYIMKHNPPDKWEYNLTWNRANPNNFYWIKAKRFYDNQVNEIGSGKMSIFS